MAEQGAAPDSCPRLCTESLQRRVEGKLHLHQRRGPRAEGCRFKTLPAPVCPPLPVTVGDDERGPPCARGTATGGALSWKRRSSLSAISPAGDLCTAPESAGRAPCSSNNQHSSALCFPRCAQGSRQSNGPLPAALFHLLGSRSDVHVNEALQRRNRLRCFAGEITGPDENLQLGRRSRSPAPGRLRGSSSPLPAGVSGSVRRCAQDGVPSR